MAEILFLTAQPLLYTHIFLGTCSNFERKISLIPCLAKTAAERTRKTPPFKFQVCLAWETSSCLIMRVTEAVKVIRNIYP